MANYLLMAMTIIQVWYGLFLNGSRTSFFYGTLRMIMPLATSPTTGLSLER